MKQVYIMTLYIGLAMLFMPQAMAGGFAVNGVSASAMGVADAVVAAADDVSAASYNPAGLAWQDGIQGMAGLKVQYRNSSSEITAGTASNRGSTGNLGHLYASWMPHDSNLGVSLAYSRPFAVDNDWSSGLPAAGQTRIKADRLSVDAIYSIGSSLAIAVGAEWYISSASLSQPGNVFNGNDKTAFGGHLSVKWKPAPMWSLGAMARMGAKLNLSGNANQTLDIQLPDELTVGVAYDLIDAVRLELDTTWSRWSKLTDLNVLSGTTLVQSNALDMQDTFTIMV
ncbi:MAG: OmpP1/FadL family transporter, partial [Mariprofundus sp.]